MQREDIAYERLIGRLARHGREELTASECDLFAEFAGDLLRSRSRREARRTWEAARALLNGLVDAGRLTPDAAVQVWQDLRACGPTGAPHHYRAQRLSRTAAA